MATQKIGRRLLKELTTVSQPTIIYDQALKGFGIKLMPPSTKNPAGARSWIVEYRPGSGGRGVAKKRIVIGSPATMTPEQARDEAKTRLADIRLGADPGAKRAEQRAAKTIAELAPVYDAATNPKRKPRTVETYASYWKNHILPAMGSTRATALTMAEVNALHITTGIEMRVTANRLVTLLAHFYTWLGKNGYVPKDHNPAKGIERFKESGKERFLTPDELGRLGAALRLGETEGIPWAASDTSKPGWKHHPKLAKNRVVKLTPQAIGAIRLLIFTGARLREILNLEWSHVNMALTKLFLPDSKSGKKPILLGGPALSVLQGLHDLAMAEARLVNPAATRPLSIYVFPTKNLDRPRHDLQGPWKSITRAANLEGLRIHDLRHSFASVGAGSGLGLPIIGKLLGHGDVKTTLKYVHLDVDPLRRANDIIGQLITNALDGASV